MPGGVVEKWSYNTAPLRAGQWRGAYRAGVGRPSGHRAGFEITRLGRGDGARASERQVCIVDNERGLVAVVLLAHDKDSNRLPSNLRGIERNRLFNVGGRAFRIQVGGN